MRVLSVITLLAALFLPFGLASGSPPIDISAEDLQTLHTQAAQGNAGAQSSLGVMYDKGHGVPQDYVRASMWLNLAAAFMRGDEQKLAVDNRDEVARRMTSAQIAEAQRLSQQCQA